MPFVRVNHFYKSASPGQTIEVSPEEADLIVSRGGGVLLPGPATTAVPAPTESSDSGSSGDAPPAAEAAPDVAEESVDVPPEKAAVAVAPAEELAVDDDSESIDVLADHGLGEKVLAALAEADIRTLAELRAVDDLTEFAGIGKVAAAKIAEALAQHDHN